MRQCERLEAKLVFYDVASEVGEGLVGNEKANFNEVQINKDLVSLEKV